MKQWLETRLVFERLAAVHATGERAALATVIRVRGSAYRHEGAKLLVPETTAPLGNVSGGCLEADVRETAVQVIASGVASVRTYCGGNDEVRAWDLGIGCDGEVEILIEPVASARIPERTALEFEHEYVAVSRLRTDGECGEASRLVFSGHDSVGTLGDEGLDAFAMASLSSWRSAAESQLLERDGVRLFVDVLRPPPRLVVVSAGDDARVLAMMADAVGFRVVVVDRRAMLLRADRYLPSIRLVDADAAALNEHLVLHDDSFAVLMTHDFADDTAYLSALLRTPARYIGMLGPRQRTERILRNVRRDGPVDESRIYGPVGLDIGTDGAEQVAIAILAELLAVQSGRAPKSLRDRTAPIHVSQPE